MQMKVILQEITKMEISEIMQLVISNGFAIVVAVWCLKFTFDTMSKNYDNTNEKLSQLTEAVNHNTQVLSNIVTRLDDKIDDSK